MGARTGERGDSDERAERRFPAPRHARVVGMFCAVRGAPEYGGQGSGVNLRDALLALEGVEGAR